MSYQGARARSEDDETHRVFAISKVRLNEAGGITDVLWAEISAKSNRDVGAPVVVPVADVIDALHDGASVSAIFPVQFGALPGHAFEVVEFADGVETIDLVGAHDTDPASRVDLRDLARLDA